MLMPSEEDQTTPPTLQKHLLFISNFYPGKAKAVLALWIRYNPPFLICVPLNFPPNSTTTTDSSTSTTLNRGLLRPAFYQFNEVVLPVKGTNRSHRCIQKKQKQLI